MTDLTTLPLSVLLPMCFGSGLVLGIAYFWSLRRTADLILSGGPALLALALTLGRFALLGAAFYLAVLSGALALLAALAGVLVAKALMVRQARGAGT